MGFMRKHSHKRWPKKFSGKFGEIRAKILRKTQKLLRLRFKMISYLAFAFSFNPKFIDN